MKVGIIYPNTETSRALFAKLLENGIKVKFLCPAAFDVDFAQNYIFELNMIGKPPQSEIVPLDFRLGHPPLPVSLCVFRRCDAHNYPRPVFVTKTAKVVFLHLKAQTGARFCLANTTETDSTLFSEFQFLIDRGLFCKFLSSYHTFFARHWLC